ncbi:hypothetical protein C922_05809 [Plasmodium inui San Antonio 1]|uniref:Uncharacterized protein n=1 Tax=Plasmodium inui San Antonio 1 TaxID=1237626 RepID=W7A3Z4_9APIC|nr:hypothetical protein C922_05809 [Plasmodium inui San Antonio 1]EUD63809.1 hypothetical protein C922_05809 [Plasmodium inui San Antonio 1]
MVKNQNNPETVYYKDYSSPRFWMISRNTMRAKEKSKLNSPHLNRTNLRRKFFKTLVIWKEYSSN